MAESEARVSQEDSPVTNQAPLVKFGGHKDEGYAIDWSPIVAGRLVSGAGLIVFVVFHLILFCNFCVYSVGYLI